MLFLFTLAVGMQAWFRGLAAACKSPSSAQSFAGVCVLVMALYTGKEFLQTIIYVLIFCRLYDTKTNYDRRIAMDNIYKRKFIYLSCLIINTDSRSP